MRRLVLLLLCSLISSQALAQGVPISAGAAAPGAIPTGKNADGKYVVGYEGRGDYIKTRNEIIAAKKDVSASTENPYIGPISGAEMYGHGRADMYGRGMAPIAPEISASAPAAVSSNRLRGDSALRGDGSAARDAAAKNQLANAKPAANASTTTPIPNAPVTTMITSGGPGPVSGMAR